VVRKSSQYSAVTSNNNHRPLPRLLLPQISGQNHHRRCFEAKRACHRVLHRERKHGHRVSHVVSHAGHALRAGHTPPEIVKQSRCAAPIRAKNISYQSPDCLKGEGECLKWVQSEPFSGKIGLYLQQSSKSHYLIDYLSRRVSLIFENRYPTITRCQCGGELGGPTTTDDNENDSDNANNDDTDENKNNDATTPTTRRPATTVPTTPTTPTITMPTTTTIPTTKQRCRQRQ
jgi:hypothetical protein